MAACTTQLTLWVSAAEITATITATDAQRVKLKRYCGVEGEMTPTYVTPEA